MYPRKVVLIVVSTFVEKCQLEMLLGMNSVRIIPQRSTHCEKESNLLRMLLLTRGSTEKVARVQKQVFFCE